MKRKLPTIKPYKSAEEQTNYFAAWLAQREVELALIEETEVDALVSKSVEWPSDLDLNYEPLIEEGQIRLLASSLLPDKRMVYVAVLKEWDNGEWLVAPFSAYTAPCLPGELVLPERTHIQLKVLSLWNMRTVHGWYLSRSWVESTLTAKEQSDAWQVYRHVAIGDSLSAELLLRVGPHVLRADDPRVAYQQQEVELLGQIPEVGICYNESYYAYTQDEQLMAADNGDVFSKCVVVPIDGMQEPVRLHAKCLDFETLRSKGDDPHCTWWVEDVADAASIMSGAVFHAGRMVAELAVFVRDGGLLLKLKHLLLMDDTSVNEPTDLELALLKG